MSRNKKMIIVINNLLCGGAQKSLVSLLNCLSQECYDLDLLVLNPANVFFNTIPEWVRVLEPPKELRAMYLSKEKIFLSNLHIGLLLKSLWGKCSIKIFKKKELDDVQNLWKIWRKLIKKLDQEYDLAISYVDGFSNYFVIDKVSAAKKILWVHNEYEKLPYNADYDRTYFVQADALVTISEACVKSLNRIFPECINKTHLLYNISSSEMIWQMSDRGKPFEYEGKKNILISIGRLNEQKGFDLAIKASRILQNNGLSYDWFIIGEGELEGNLLNQIRIMGVEKHVHLLGLKKNPYPYIRYADIFVQPSRYEGKSIVLDEAKILHKPIVVTNYDTVYDSIEHGINGSICCFEENELADSIADLIRNIEKMKFYSKNLSEEMRDNMRVDAYLRLFETI